MSIKLTRLHTLLLGVAAVFLFLGFAAVGLWGAYYKHWESPTVVSMSRVVPIPAARLGSRTVTYADYLASVRSVRTYMASDEAKNLGVARAITDEDRKNALERLIREQALFELAEARNATLSEQQIEAAVGEFNAAGSSTEEIVAFLQTNFAWTMQDFKDHVIRPVLLTRLMAGPYAADHGNDPNALEAYLDERTRRDDVVRFVKF